MHSDVEKARACRQVAEDIRLTAEAIKDDAQRASLLRTAISYERVARRLESAGDGTGHAPVTA